MEKHKLNLLYRWIRLAQAGITLEKLLAGRKLQKVAIYGYDKIAECILYELKYSSVSILAIIDKKGDKILVDYPAVKPDEIANLDVDVIIMMPVDNYQIIKSDLCHYTTTKIISIEEILYEL